MTQTVMLSASLGVARSGQAIGYRVLNPNRTQYSAFTTTGVVENPAGSGDFHVSGGVVVPDAGGYIVVGISGTDYKEAAVDPVGGATAADIWGYSGGRTLTSFGTLVADVAAAVWGYVTRTLTAFGANSLTEFTYTVTDSVTTLPLSNVEVWFSTDGTRANVVWYGVTDAFGVARDAYGNLPRLNAGTYYIWRRLSGFTFNDPDVEAVG